MSSLGRVQVRVKFAIHLFELDATGVDLMFLHQGV
jgi:hypothetical protein